MSSTIRQPGLYGQLENRLVGQTGLGQSILGQTSQVENNVIENIEQGVQEGLQQLQQRRQGIPGWIWIVVIIIIILIIWLLLRNNNSGQSWIVL